jgi:ankyrin repeat protein
MALVPTVGRPYTPPIDQINWWERDHHGNNKWKNTTVKTINLIHQENSAYVKTKDRQYARLPLHRAIIGNAAKEVIFTIYELYPTAIKHHENNGYLPMHWAAEKNRVDIIPYLYNKFPVSILKEDKVTNTPLDLALRFEKIEAYYLFEEYLNSMIVDNTAEIEKEKQKQILASRMALTKHNWKEKNAFSVEAQDAAKKAAVEKQKAKNLQSKSSSKSRSKSRSKSPTQADTPSHNMKTQERSSKALSPKHMRNSRQKLSGEQQKEEEERFRMEKLDNSNRARRIIEKYQINHLYCNTFSEEFVPKSRWVNTSVNTVIRLNKYNPEAVHKPNSYGLLPLNYAVQNNARVDVVKKMYDFNPYAIKHKDNNGEVVLHDAARNNVSADIIMFLTDSYPEAMTIQSKDGNTPLDLAKKGSYKNKNKCKAAEKLLLKIERDMKMTNEQDWIRFARKNIGQIKTLYSKNVTKWEYTSVKHIRELHHKNSHHVKTPDGTDTKQWLPLSYAIYSDASSDVVKHLYELYPAAIEQKDSYKYLPLHIAAEKDRGKHIPFLTQKFPLALRIKDIEGKTPLQRAIYSKSKIAVKILTKLENQYKSQLDETEQIDGIENSLLKKKYWLLAREVDNLYSTSDKWERTTIDTITYLHKCHPKDCVTEGVGGVLPFHIAIRNNASVEVVKLIYSFNRSCIKHKDNLGWLPLHYAADYNRVVLIPWLVELFPTSLKISDKRHRTAKDIAANLKNIEAAAMLEKLEVELGIYYT